MNVRQLIEQLQKLPPDMLVLRRDRYSHIPRWEPFQWSLWPTVMVKPLDVWGLGVTLYREDRTGGGIEALELS